MSRRPVAVIGNSHLAALKLGSDHPGVVPDWADLTFFGAAAGGLWNLRGRDGVLIPETGPLTVALKRTSGGKSVIDLNDYDAYLLVGMMFGLGELVPGLRDHRPPGLHTSDYTLVSRSFLAAAAADRLGRSLAVITARKIRRFTDAPIVIVPEPLPDPAVADPSPDAAYYQAGIWSSPELVQLMTALYDEGCRGIEAEHGVVILSQPEETRQGGVFTKPELAAGGLAEARTIFQRDENEDAHDDFHMNAAYGAVVLAEALGQVEVLTRDHVKTMKLKEKREPVAAPVAAPAKPWPGFQGLARKLFGKSEPAVRPRGRAGRA